MENKTKSFGLAVLFTAFSAWAHAGDIAAINVIGFSPDNGIFAFEEYGVQDGSGFAYSNIYFVNTEKDAYLPGTPVRVRLEDEPSSLAAARGQAHEKAASLIVTHKLEEKPGIVAAFNPISEQETDAKALRYLTVQSSPPFGKPFRLALEEIDFAQPDNCYDPEGKFKGFRLTFTEVDGAPANAVVYEDKTIPASRGCPNSYRLGGIAVTGENDGPHMALVQVLRFGFEGNDGRWIAIPVRPTQ